MLSTEEERALERLGYDRLWIDRGVLSRRGLSEQVRALDEEHGDQNLEHYRGATLSAFLAGKATLSDDEIATILRLGELDPDPSFRSHFPHALIRFHSLDDRQFELVASQVVDDAFVRVVARHRHLRALAQGAPMAVTDAIASRDGQVHAALLERKLSNEQLEQLANDGANKAIRNRARQLLQSSRRLR